MSLQQWANNGWLKAHQTSPKEIQDLLKIVERDLLDAVVGDLSADWRFGIAYNAALKLCTILIYVSGYRPEKSLQHYRTLQALPLILGPIGGPTRTTLMPAASSGTPSNTTTQAARPRRMPTS